MNWSKPIANQNAFHRAAGRRKLNAQRRRAKLERKALILQLALRYLQSGGRLDDRGLQSQVSASTGLAKSTVCQYFKELETHLASLQLSCCCGFSVQINLSPDGIQVKGCRL